HSPWFLNCGKAFQPLFLHWSLLVGAISTGAVSEEVKLSVSVAADPVIVTCTADVPSSWKFPLVVWIVAVYGAPVTVAWPPIEGPQPEGKVRAPDLLPVIVVVPEVIVNVALKAPELSDQVP